MNCWIAREKGPVRKPASGSSSQPELCELVDTLRCRGYAVHLDASSAETRAQLSTYAARFVESALAVAAIPSRVRHTFVSADPPSRSLSR